ncbi:MAG: hypothetical protein DRG80_06685 [Deltaproteobacteria bacterium]|nr:MAG: hypothetical protein DRG80_06685 [Deltaproteobacteria bacterium]
MRVEREADRFHDECGVFGIHGHDEAAHIVYLGLYALQHRGQESCGIVSSNGREHTAHRAMAMVNKMDELCFGNCSNERECEAECPKEISISNIARLNREFFKAGLASAVK